MFNTNSQTAGVTTQKWYKRSHYLLVMLVVFFLATAGLANVSSAASAVFALLTLLVIIVLCLKLFDRVFRNRLKSADKLSQLAASGNNISDIQRKGTSWGMTLLWLTIGIAPLPAFLNSLKPNQKKSTLVLYAVTTIFFYALFAITAWKKRHESMAGTMSRQRLLAPYLFVIAIFGAIGGQILAHFTFTMSPVIVCTLLGLFLGIATWTITLKLFPKLLATTKSTGAK